MRGVLAKIFFETRWQWIGFSLGLCLVMGLLTALLPKVLGDIHRVFDRLPFLKPLITALLGVDPGDQLSGAMSQAFLWVHPTVLTLVWAHEVIYCTRTPAGEIDRGTIDFLLGLPVSRWTLFLCEVLGWLVSGAVILLCGYVGHLVAAVYHEPSMRPPLEVTAYVMLNLFAVYMAVGGFCFLVSSLSDRRGRAMGTIFAVLLLSFLINFVAQFWDPLKEMGSSPVASSEVRVPLAETKPKLLPSLPSLPGLPDAGPTAAGQGESGMSLAMFSVMHYYRPAIIIQQGLFPWKDIGLLLGVACICLIAAAITLRRRSICTV